MNWDYMIERMNSGSNREVEAFFGSYETFFNILAKKGYILELNPFGKFWETQFKNWSWEKDKNIYRESLRNVNVFYNNESYYYRLDSINNLVMLFCNGEKYKKDFLSFFDENYEYFFYDYYDLINDDNIFKMFTLLNNENKNFFYKLVLDILKGHKLDICSDKMQFYASNSDYLILNKENIVDLLNDRESFECILSNEAYEIYKNLTEILRKSYYRFGKKNYMKLIVRSLNDLFEITEKEFRSLKNGSLLKLSDRVKEYIEEYGVIVGSSSFLEFLDSDFTCLEINWYPELSNVELERGVVYINKIFKENII